MEEQVYIKSIGRNGKPLCCVVKNGIFKKEYITLKDGNGKYKLFKKSLFSKIPATWNEGTWAAIPPFPNKTTAYRFLTENAGELI